jgi:hypothetical protein
MEPPAEAVTTTATTPTICDATAKGPPQTAIHDNQVKARDLVNDALAHENENLV